MRGQEDIERFVLDLGKVETKEQEVNSLIKLINCRLLKLTDKLGLELSIHAPFTNGYFGQGNQDGAREDDQGFLL